MPRYVAFLRAINVRPRFVTMEKLRALFEALDYAKVETFIQSGNVLFSTPKKNTGGLERQIEAQLLGSLGFEVATFVRTLPELAAIAQRQVFPQTELRGNISVYVAFVQAAPQAEAQRRLFALRNPVDDFQLREREVYWLRRRSVGESAFSGARLERALGVPATIRDFNSLKKLLAKHDK